MSLELGDDNEIRGSGGGALMGLLAGSCLNKDRDDGRSMTWFAMVIVLIVFFIAIIFLALAFKENKGYDRVHNNGNYGELLATMIAAKGMDNNCCKSTDFDMMEIKNKLETSENRARETQTQQEIGSVKSELGAVALMMQKTAADNEMKNLTQFGEIKGQLGMLSQGVNTLLTERNNAAIIQGVVNQLMLGRPC